jgi:hypothetical protein
MLRFDSPLRFDAANLVHVGAWALGALLALYVVLYSWRDISALLRFAHVRWLALYSLFAVVSTVYSPSPWYTLYWAGQSVIFLVLSLWLSVAWGPKRVLTTLVVAYSLQAIIIALLYVLAPSVVGVSLMGGYRLHGGPFSDYGVSFSVSALAVLASILFVRPASSLEAVARVMALSALCGFALLSQTRSTLIGLVLGTVVLMVLRGGPRRAASVVVLLGCIFTVAGLAGVDRTVIDYVLRGQTFEELATLSNRDLAFGYLLSRWSESPVWGFGFAAGSRMLLADFVELTGHAMGSAHDALSRALADLGVVGALLLFATLGSVLRFFWRSGFAVRKGLSMNMRAYALCAALLALEIIRSVASSGIAEGSRIFMCVVLVMPALMGYTGFGGRLLSHPAGHIGKREVCR